ncbi:hypothetical protein Tco_1285144 [Tanacetum coccineum]
MPRQNLKSLGMSKWLVVGRPKQKREMSADVARGHSGDGGGDDRPPPYQYPPPVGVKDPKAQFRWRKSGQLLIPRQETQNLEIKAITDNSDPVPIRLSLTTERPSCLSGDQSGSLGQLPRTLRELPWR